MAERVKDPWLDNHSPMELACAPFVAYVTQSPAAGYVRTRVNIAIASGEPFAVAFFQAMSDYTAEHPLSPVAVRYSPCPVCGRGARIYPGKRGWPDMAHCPRCDKTHIVAAEPVAESEKGHTKTDWWQE